jgi:ribosomal protein L11 methyltransferase
MLNSTIWMKLTVHAALPVLEALASLLVDWGAEGVVEAAGQITVYFSPTARKDVESRLRRYCNDLGEPVRWTWGADVGELWRDNWKAHFRPARVSRRLAVCPSWERWTAAEPQVKVIRMDPGLAFGTGTHETTRLCLRLLDETLARTPVSSVLDVGCGSGILSIGARLLGAPQVVALDVDATAVSVARKNARVNGVADGFLILRGDPRALRAAYSLVVANILYQVLAGLAPVLARRVTPGGRLLLSGMLEAELTAAAAVYRRVGFVVDGREIEGEWGALLLRKEQQASPTVPA